MVISLEQKSQAPKRRRAGLSPLLSLVVLGMVVFCVGVASVFFVPAKVMVGGSGITVAPVTTSVMLTPEIYSGATVQLDLNSSWRTDAVWYDGKAEYAVYDAHRPIYGKDRHYEAVLITNKQQMDPKTTTKSADWKAAGQVEVFKHNLREVIPTENYVYKYLTTAFVRADDLRPFKLTMSSQEDCGATFKHFVADGSRVKVDTFVYFPDDGPRHFEYAEPGGMQFQDDLSLALRGYPFDNPPKEAMILGVVPDQTFTHATPGTPTKSRITYQGKEMLDLPIGKVEAYKLQVVMEGSDGADIPGGGVATYWFAADGGAEWLHIMVKYDGPFGVKYELKSKKRWDYWVRR